MTKKPTPSNLEDIETIINLLNTFTVGNHNSHTIRTIYNTYVSDYRVCMRCPSSIMNALNDIKKTFTLEQLNTLKSNLNVN